MTCPRCPGRASGTPISVPGCPLGPLAKGSGTHWSMKRSTQVWGAVAGRKGLFTGALGFPGLRECMCQRDQVWIWLKRATEESVPFHLYGWPAVAVLNPAVTFGGDGLPHRKTHKSPSVCKRPSPGLPRDSSGPHLASSLLL